MRAGSQLSNYLVDMVNLVDMRLLPQRLRPAGPHIRRQNLPIFSN